MVHYTSIAIALLAFWVTIAIILCGGMSITNNSEEIQIVVGDGPMSMEYPVIIRYSIDERPVIIVLYENRDVSITDGVGSQLTDESWYRIDSKKGIITYSIDAGGDQCTLVLYNDGRAKVIGEGIVFMGSWG